MCKIVSPLYIEMWVKKIRKFYINLNRVKAMHYIQYNNLKKKYKEVMKDQIEVLPKYDKIKMILTYYHPTKRLSDLDNQLVVQSKFFQDALVELWKIEDDNYEYIKEVTYKYWWYDKNNWRVEIELLNTK